MPTVITQADDQSNITVPVGGVIGLHLGENPSTGFQWSFEQLDSSLEIVEEEFHVAGTPLVPGAAGVHEWRLRAAATGRHTLRMRHSQPWEGDAAVDRRFTVDIIAV